MLQDISPAVYNNTYSSEKPRLQDICFMFDRDTVLVKRAGNSLEFPTYGMLSSRVERFSYLFRINDINYFLVNHSDISRYGYKFINIRELRTCAPKESVFALMTAYHLHTWYSNNRFCGRCGKLMHHNENMRALDCECGNQVFPQIAPAVIVAVLNDDKILLTKYKGRAYKNYALIAGFAEIGETLEDTVAREVMEETGLRVKRIRYYASQPWGVDSNLLMGFFARLDGSPDIELEEDELSEAGWFRRGEIDMVSDGVSLTGEMIQAFKDGYNG
ncbi:MAG: NAD(+) diphosphatase [Clostridia bacterium]|nr:NAD(+) diphosphatase [Clostridia bacterium]